MDLNSVNYKSVSISQQETYIKKGNKEFYSKNTSLSAESRSVDPGAVYDQDEKPEILTDTGYKVDMDQVIAMKEESEQRMVDLFRETVKNGLGKQAGGLKNFLNYAMDRFGVSAPEGNNGTANYTINISIEIVSGKLLTSDDTDAISDVQQAQADVAEDGYWGAEAVSDRFLDFAKALSGGDESKADMLLDAVKAGYEAAEEIWGEALPQLSQDTLAMTIEKFEAWRDGREDDGEVEEV